VQIYRTDTGTFANIPNPDKVISFADDNRPLASCPSVDNRQYFTGCCNNPAFNGASSVILYPGRPIGEQLGVSSTFTRPNDPCNRYVVLNPPPTGDPSQTQALLLRVNDAQCGVGEPAFNFQHAGTIYHSEPAGYTRDQWYFPWVNVWPLPGSSTELLGFRHVKSLSTGSQGQASFTVTPNLN